MWKASKVAVKTLTKKNSSETIIYKCANCEQYKKIIVEAIRMIVGGKKKLESLLK